MKPKQPRGIRIPENVMKLLEAMGKVKRAVRITSRYTRHIGPWPVRSQSRFTDSCIPHSMINGSNVPRFFLFKKSAGEILNKSASSLSRFFPVKYLILLAISEKFANSKIFLDNIQYNVY